MFDLIRKVAGAMAENNAEEVLLEAFNDESIQNCIITHVKVCSSSPFGSQIPS